MLKFLRDSFKKQIGALRLQRLNLRKKLCRVDHKMQDYKRFLMLLQNNKIDRLQQLLDVQVKRGSSIHAVCAKLEEAMSSRYSATGKHSEDELDLLLLVVRLGGKTAS